jgi:RNA polymerase sigma factor (sigma-70 family)
MPNASLESMIRQIRRLAEAPGAQQADRVLLESFVERREPEAFASLVRRHGPLVLGVCRRALKNGPDVEDVFQATFLLLAQKARSIRKQESVGSWLYGVAHRLALRTRANADKRRRHERNAGYLPRAETMDDLTWRELRAALDEELARLPDKYRAPLLLCYLEGKTQDEAARQLAWSKATVKKRLTRGRNLLRSRLTRRGLAPGVALLATLLAESMADAAVPGLLVESTTRGVAQLAAGQAAGGAISAQAVALAQGVLKSALATKLKFASAILLVALASIAGLAARQAFAGKRPDATPPAVFGNNQTITTPSAVVPQGDLAAKRPEAPKSLVVAGQVLGADGLPLVGGKIHLWTKAARNTGDLPVRAETDRDGKFQFSAREQDIEQGGIIVAKAAGYGPDWNALKKLGDGELLHFKLFRDDLPITGRVLTLEGQPVAEARVEIVRVGKKPGGEDLASWVKKNVTMRSKGTYLNEEGLQTIPASILGLPETATTGKDGRFQLTGAGRERVVTLNLRGPTIQHTRVWAATRPGPERGWIPGSFGLYAATFSHFVSPTKPFVGTIRDRRTGMPLAGVSIEGGSWEARTTTDANGKYRLIGVPKGQGYGLIADGRSGLPYFNVTKSLSDTAGLEPITADFELERGIEITGRLTDRATGKPVQGNIHYFPLPDNPRKDFLTLDGPHAYSYVWGNTNQDGAFTVLGIPGPGVLVASAKEADRYVMINTRQELMKVKINEFPVDRCHALARIDPQENDPKSMTCNMAIELGNVRDGSIVGPNGKPLDGVQVAGLSATEPPRVLTSGAFSLTGLRAAGKRLLVFIHPEKKLGNVQIISGKEDKPLMVRLEPLATIAGRMVDEDGKPMAGLTITSFPAPPGADYENLPQEFHIFQGVYGLAPGVWRDLTTRTAKTDRDGRFQVDGLLPGLPYALYACDGDIQKKGTLVCSRKDVVLEAGKTKDLGEMRKEPTPGD